MYFYLFRKRKARGSNTYYTCREAESQNCKATATTIEADGMTYIKSERGEHTHSSGILKKRVKSYERQTVDNAAKNPTVAPRTILAGISNKVQNESMAASTSLSNMNTMRIAIYRARRKEQGVVDRLPSTPEDLLNLDPSFKTLKSGENFLVSQERLDEESVVLIFMSDFGKRILQASNTFYMDGTFSTCPEPFGQLYTVFADGGGPVDKIYPCAFMLLPNKKSDTYDHAFFKLKQLLDHSPNTINIDFEQAVIKSIKKIFPNCQVGGCYFHWKKSIYTNIGLKQCLPLYNNDETFQVGVELIYSLSLLPTTDVVQGYETVVLPFFEKECPKTAAVDDFLAYIERTYIGKKSSDIERGNPLFPLSMWNIRERILSDMQTTTNGFESWHSRWANSLGTNHSIYSVIHEFMNKDALACFKFLEVIAGRATNPNPSKKGRRSERLEMLKLTLQGFKLENMKEFLNGNPYTV